MQPVIDKYLANPLMWIVIILIVILTLGLGYRIIIWYKNLPEINYKEINKKLKNI